MSASMSSPALPDPLFIVAETLGNDCSFAEVAQAVVSYDERVRQGNDTKQFALSFLFNQIDGHGMLARGQKTKKVGDFIFHVAPPGEREYCLCHRALLYQCPTPIDERPGVFRRTDSRPSMYVTKVGDDA